MARAVLEELKATVEREEKTKKREFKGFNATLVVEGEEFSLEVPVKYAKIDSKIIKKMMNIRAVRKDNGKAVQRKYVAKVIADFGDGNVEVARSFEFELADGRVVRVEGKSERVWIDEDGEEGPAENVTHVQNGVEVEEFSRTKEIVIGEWIPAQQLAEFLPDHFYEIWGEKPRDIAKLLKIAKWMTERGVAGLCRHFSFGGFKAYATVIYPVFSDGEFVLVMMLTRMRKRYNHMMPTEVREEEEERRKAKPKQVLLI